MTLGADQFDGCSSIGKKVIGEIAEFDGQFAIVKNLAMLKAYIKSLKKRWKLD